MVSIEVNRNTYKMLEETSASAYVLHPFQALVPRFWKIRERIRVVLRVGLRE